MDSMLQGSLSDWLKGILIDFIASNLGGMLADVNQQAGSLGTELAMSPSAWSPDIWTMIEGIATTVVVPIAAMVLTYAMCMELIGWANDMNHLHSTSDVITKLFKFVIKLGIGVLLVQKALDITMGIFDLGSYVIMKSMGVVDTQAGLLTVDTEAIKAGLQGEGFGALFSLVVTTLLGSVGMWIIGIVLRLVVAGRMIEIYIYCACGSAPYATLTNKELSGVGQNYIKNLFSLAFQGFFMFLMLGIYVALMRSTMSSITGGGDPKKLVTEVLLVSVTLVMMLLRSKSIAKSIFSAH